MAYQLKKTLAVALTIGALNVFSEVPVSAVTFNFTQGSWSQGGILTGSFEGEDLNGDSFILETEVTDFLLAWSGNGEVPALDFMNVDRWQFSTRQARLILGFASQATSFWSYDGSQGLVGIGGVAGIISDTTQEAPVFDLANVEAVPETTSIVASLVAFSAVLLKKRL